MPYDLTYGGPSYFGETLVSSVHVTADGGVDFTTGGSLDGNSAIFYGFMLNDHQGVVDTRTQGKYQYHAMPLGPDGNLGEGGASGSGAGGSSGMGEGGTSGMAEGGSGPLPV